MSFNWLPRISPYAQAQQWTARQAAFRLDAEDVLSALSDKLSTAATDQISGLANLAAQAALDRINAAVKAKAAQAQSSSTDTTLSNFPSDPNPNSVNLPDGSTIQVDTSTYLAGGSKINLAAGTLTLPDGTVIDAKTGAKKVDVTA
jgi:hypothetical protein